MTAGRGAGRTHYGLAGINPADSYCPAAGPRSRRGKVGAEDLHDPNLEKWTSKYGSLVTTVYGLGAADGMNERGLAAHMLYLNAADFGARDAKLPGAQAGLWAQYALDNAPTVAEALDNLMKIQPIAIDAHTATRPMLL